MEITTTITDQQLKILRGEICPYCGKKPEMIDSAEVYGIDYGKLYLCRKCNAYVGVHKGTNKAKGRLANKSLRKAKVEAHKYFDMIWKQNHLPRSDAYQWLSARLGFPVEYTHIGMFGTKTCAKVVSLSKQLLNDMRRLDLDMGVEPKTKYFET